MREHRFFPILKLEPYGSGFRLPSFHLISVFENSLSRERHRLCELGKSST